MKHFLFGATSIPLFLLFILKMDAGIPHTAHKTYYAILCSIFSLIYISSNLKNSILYIIFIIIICWSSVVNYYFRHKENGIYYHQIADFMAKELTVKSQITISFAPTAEPLPWIYETWSAAFKYYFPDKNITFKFPWLQKIQGIETSMYFYRRYFEAGKMTKISPEPPSSGDYYIIKKTSPDYKKDIQNINLPPVFENRIFEVYLIR